MRVLEAYAAQCAQAVDRVVRLEAERRRASETRSLAETLQRSMLTDPPEAGSLRIAVRYRPAAREAQVGGDWYDAFLSPDGATTLVVGDVTGHDQVAAAVMGQLRNVLRGVVHALDAPPARALSALDRALHGGWTPSTPTTSRWSRCTSAGQVRRPGDGRERPRCRVPPRAR